MLSYLYIRATATATGWHVFPTKESLPEVIKQSNQILKGNQFPLGTRITGSLPQFIYSIAPDGLYVNLYEPSEISWTGESGPLHAVMRTTFPKDPRVDIEIHTSQAQRAK